MEHLIERIEVALAALSASGPRNLLAYLSQPGPDFTVADPDDVDTMLALVLSPDPNNPARLRFSHLLRSWDNAKDAKWTAGTKRNTVDRRRRIHDLLQPSAGLRDRIDGLLPFYPIDEPLIISEEHDEWYKPSSGARDYYWSTYCKYLRTSRSWDDDALINLDNTTRAIVECLANPESKLSYSSRGLVMGYVQSGKTANFTGVIARAADAGYRLVIVLAGTWNILRNQTQRRFDKELLGKELLLNDDSYLPPPTDWNEFLEHGANPGDIGYYTWQRLTRPNYDFKQLKAAIDSLEFERVNKALPLYDPANLHSLPVKLLVVKKHSGILAGLVRDFKLLRTRLTELPTLIIDDESDQAGINTVDPKKRVQGKERSATNLKIVELVQLFPRGQYVGYTATPYANALVDPDDPEDMFPKDFVISLDRPRRYMGVSDFFDPLVDYEDLDHEDFTQAEIAFIRRVESPQAGDDNDLKDALRSYVLSGGIKLFRQSKDFMKYKPEHFRHHTMLVHTSPRTAEHKTLAERLKELWDQCAFNSPPGLTELEKLWAKDFSKVCRAQGDDLVPTTFAELIPHLSEAIKRIERGLRVFLVVNDDVKDAPDFNREPVWKIIMGGNKLSRGYTIEGLTISYYRREGKTADTLMQMGRWFGFRPGYKDLVRVFLGVADGRKGDTDLVSQFKEVCRMEERFRDEVKRYLRTPGLERITPKQVPPLIQVSGSLPPTARNKMFNATLASKNFGGKWSMFTLTASKPGGLTTNIRLATSLLSSAHAIGNQQLGGTTKRMTNGVPEARTISAEMICFTATNEQVIQFLREYRWLEADYPYPSRPADMTLQMDFIKDARHGISSWLILAPQRKVSHGKPLELSGATQFAVKKRQRNAGRGFQVFGEPDHRVVAEYLSAVQNEERLLVAPNASTSQLRDPHRGILLLYPVRTDEANTASIGFELLFPKNDLSYDMNFTVRRASERSRIVVLSDEDDG